MIVKLNEAIRQPWFSAGQKFGWEGSGVSINIKHLKDLGEEDSICFYIRGLGKWFVVSKAKARELHKKYKSSFPAKYGVTLVCLPVLQLEEYTPE